MTPTMNRMNKPSTSYIRFFFKNSATRSANQIIITPLMTMATAMVAKSFVSAMALRMESKEKTKFMITIIVTAFATVLREFVSSPS